MDSALVTAKTMYEDFTLLNAVSWQLWIAVSEVDYCDGLIYINLDEKTFEITKRYYVTGNYSKYVTPGSKRIEANIDDKDILVTAFKNSDEIILVIVNNSECEKGIVLPRYNDIMLSVTDKDNNLAEAKAISNQIKLTPKSVTTVVMK